MRSGCSRTDDVVHRYRRTRRAKLNYGQRIRCKSERKTGWSTNSFSLVRNYAWQFLPIKRKANCAEVTGLLTVFHAGECALLLCAVT